MKPLDYLKKRNFGLNGNFELTVYELTVPNLYQDTYGWDE